MSGQIAMGSEKCALTERPADMDHLCSGPVQADRGMWGSVELVVLCCLLCCAVPLPGNTPALSDDNMITADVEVQ